MTPLRARAARTTAVLTAATALLAATAATAGAAEPPTHDDLANALPIGLGYTGQADLAAATTETDEPLSACLGLQHTVWYSFTPTADGAVELDTAGSLTDTAFVVWDSPDLHDPLVCAADDGDSLQARATFPVQAGTTYLFQVGADLERGGEPGLLQLALREAPRLTGKPQTSASRDAGLAAGAFWQLPTDDEGEFHVAQLDVSDRFQRSSGGTPERLLDLTLQSRRLTLEPDGRRHADEWFGTLALERGQLELRDGLRGAAVDAVVELERHRCTSVGPDDVGSVCGWLPPVSVRVRASWIGVGEVSRDLLDLRSSGYGYRSTGTAHFAWRGADVTATVTGAPELDLSGKGFAVLLRDAVATTLWSRS